VSQERIALISKICIGFAFLFIILSGLLFKNGSSTLFLLQREWTYQHLGMLSLTSGVVFYFCGRVCGFVIKVKRKA